MTCRATMRAAAAVFGLSMLASACSSGGSGHAGASSGSSAAPLPELVLAEQGYNASQMLIYIAQTQGFFTQAGVQVKIADGLGSAALTEIAAGQADITTAGTSTPLSIAQKGQGTSIVLATVGGGQTGFLVGNPKTAPSIDALKSLKSCTINTYIQGSPQYGWALLLNKTLGTHCTVVPYSDVPSETASLVGGRADAVVSSYSGLASAIAANQVVPLIDTRDPAQTTKYYGQIGLVSTGVDFGMSANLKKKRTAVVGYIKGTMLAQTWATEHSDSDIASLLHQYKGFDAQPVTLLESQVKAARPYLFAGSDNGRYTQAQWNDVLQSLDLDGIPGYDKQADVYSYANRVDMSYYDAAAKVK